MNPPGLIQGLIGRIGVYYLRQKNLGTFLESIGLVLDGAADGMIIGARRSQPYRCTVDAFGDLSKDRKIRIYPNESEASIRYRLAHWRQIRRTRGCHYGEMLNVQPFFLGPGGATIQPSNDSYLPWIRVYHQSGDPGGGTLTTCHTLSPTGVYTWERAAFQWNWDGLSERWSRFWMVIYLPIGFAGNGFAWDDGTLWDAGPVWDGIPMAMLDAIVAGVLESKAAHSRFSGLIVTSLQPGDDIPEHAGVHPFDPQSAYTSNASHSTNLPDGNWASAVYPTGSFMGLNARAPWATFYAIDNG